MARPAQSLNVFIASPGGLDEERDLVATTVTDFSASTAIEHGIVLVPHRYEQMVGNAGNPQAQINVRANECDIFIGMVHRRWGSDTGNGYDSGFDEEFRIALQRFQETGSPRIVLMFKQVDADSLKDQGPELVKVSAFREEIEREHHAFYKAFTQPLEVSNIVMQVLATEAITAALASRTSGAEVTVSQPTEKTPVGVPQYGGIHSEQLSELLASFSTAAGGGEPSNPLDRDRLEMFGLSISRDYDPFPVHLSNRMFERRAELHLTDFEVRAWLTTFVRDHGNATPEAARVIPFISVAGGGAELTRLLLLDAEALTTHNDILVRRGALRLFTLLGLRPEVLWPARLAGAAESDFIAAWWSWLDAGDLQEALVYALTVHKTRDGRFIDAMIRSVNDRVRDFGTLLRSLVRKNPTAELLYDTSPALLENPIVRQQFPGESPERSLPTDTLHIVTTSQYAPTVLRTGALRALIERDEVTDQIVRQAITGKGRSLYGDGRWQHDARDLLFGADMVPLSVIAAMSAALESEDWSADSSSRSRVRLCLARLARTDGRFDGSFEQMMAGMSAFEIDRVKVQFARNEGSPVLVEDAAALLKGGSSEILSRLVTAAGDPIEQSLVDYIRETIELEAIRYLVSLGEPRLVKPWMSRLRQYAAANGEASRHEAMAILETIFEDQDIELLWQDRRIYTSATPVEYAELLLRKATLKRLTATLEVDDPPLVLAALRELMQRERPPTAKALKGLLHHSDATVRVEAVRMLCDGATEDAVHSMMREYTHSRDTYYYNVVAAFDWQGCGLPAHPY